MVIYDGNKLQLIIGWEVIVIIMEVSSLGGNVKCNRNLFPSNWLTITIL